MLHETFIAPFADYEFMRRALVGAVALAISGSPLGVFLILRRMSLAGDALSHAILPGAAIGYLVYGLSLPAMTFGGLAAGLAVAVVSSAAARFTALREDASLAAFYLVSLALGVAIVSLKGSNVDLLHVLFGSVLALDDQTLIFLAAIASFTLLALAAAFRALALDTLDPLFARRVGRLGEAVPFAFLALVVLNLVAGFHALGTLMAVGVIMLPAASARLWTQDLTIALPLAAAIGALSSYLGLVLSFRTGLPAGPVIILMAGAAYFLSLIFGRTGGVVRLRRPRRHLEG
jgi:zinc/manganese transport system permease protein